MNRLDPRIALTLTALLLAPAVLLAAGSSKSSVPSGPAPEAQMTPQQKAMAAFNEGLDYRNRAWELEEEIASGDGKAEKKAMKAQKAYEKAIERFQSAVEQKPDFHQAWSSLGYALRRTGQYQESLEAYDRSLSIDPRYVEAIEYRGEAFLGVDRIEEAKAAYMQLFQLDRERAAELMTAMKQWLEERRSDAGGLSPETIDSFATWIEERSDLVAQVGTLVSLDRSW